VKFKFLKYFLGWLALVFFSITSVFFLPGLAVSSLTDLLLGALFLSVMASLIITYIFKWIIEGRLKHLGTTGTETIAQEGGNPMTIDELSSQSFKTSAKTIAIFIAVLAFAFNKPAVLIETNIRSVFIHSFFNDTNKKIADRDILPLIEETLDEKNPRTWYCALMDYGAVLKKSNTAITKRSAHYKQQGAFKGSTRYIRGSIIKLFEEKQVWSQQMMEHNIKEKSAVVKQQLNQLTKDGLLTKHGRFYLIAD